MTSTLVIATWSDGVFVLSAGEVIRHDFAGQCVGSLTRDGRGGVLAIVDGRTLVRGSASGEWRTIAASPAELACCVVIGDRIYAGTNDARIWSFDAEGHGEPLEGFDAVAGRGTWYAGAAVIDGKVLGPPLGIRSMSATCDGAVLLANVHVGGIPRSLDGGRTWQPTIDLEVDVHQVCAHPTRPELIAAAAGAGLCISRDAGASWTVEQQGLHAPHCSAVAFAGDDVLVTASVDPFAAQGAVYRRPIDGDGPLSPLGGGLPRWTSGKCDTGCIDARETTVALVDRAGNVHVSEDRGRTWSSQATGRQDPSGLVVI
jgi:hypothetical protein